MMENVRCEVLNSTYEPLSTVPLKKAMTLCAKGKAKVLAEHPSYVIHTADDIYGVPVQIIMNYLVRPKRNARAPALLTPQNLRVRDKFTCQYCGRHKTELDSDAGEKLTRDHVYPQDKGGPDVWTNVVLACSTCNNKKANMLLEEFEAMTGMKLRRKPYTPTVYEIGAKAKANFHKIKPSTVS